MAQLTHRRHRAAAVAFAGRVLYYDDSTPAGMTGICHEVKELEEATSLKKFGISEFLQKATNYYNLDLIKTSNQAGATYAPTG